ncbi:cytochrome P450 [Streptomyces sp. MN6]
MSLIHPSGAALTAEPTDLVPAEPAAPPPAGSGCPLRLHGSTPGRSITAEGHLLRQYGDAPAVELPGGVRARVVVSHRLAQSLSADSEGVSRDAAAHWPGFADGTRKVEGVIAAWTATASRNALNSYGENHRRLRAPIAAALTKRRVEAMTPAIEAIVEEALDHLANGPDIADVVPGYALRIPHQVIVRLLGMPADLMAPFYAAAAGLFDTSATAEEMAASMERVTLVLEQLVALRRASPADDLVSDLIRAADEADDPLTDVELRDQLMLVIIAGTETTVHAIGNFLVHLLTHPAQRDLVVRGDVPLEDALEESLRLQPPAASVPLRFAVRDLTDTESGESFHQGEEILILLSAAGTDPAVHDQPDVFDVRRPTARRHLAFGHGEHFCPGAVLARREIAIAAARFLDRFPSARLATAPEELTLTESFISNGHQAIPVQLRGRRRDEVSGRGGV